MGALTSGTTAGGGGDATVESVYGSSGVANLTFASLKSAFAGWHDQFRHGRGRQRHDEHH